MWRVTDERVDVIVFAIAGEQFAPHARTHLPEVAFEPFERGSIKNATPILCDEDQVHRERENAVPACPNPLHVDLRLIMLGA